jgi:hypothetical protein
MRSFAASIRSRCVPIGLNLQFDFALPLIRLRFSAPRFVSALHSLGVLLFAATAADLAYAEHRRVVKPFGAPSQRRSGAVPNVSAHVIAQ